MTLKAVRASSSVLAMLPLRPSEGRVHSAYRRAANVLGGTDLWVSLHPAGVPLHAYSIVVEGDGGCRAGLRPDSTQCEEFLGAHAGERAQVSRSLVEIGQGRVHIDLADVAVWDSKLRPLGPTARDRMKSVSYGETMRLLCRLAREQPAKSAFLAAVLNLEMLSGDSVAYPVFGARIGDILDGIATSWRAQSLELLASNLRSTVGLGQGLTPSGDDFLVGFLGAWRFLSGGDALTETLFTSLADQFCKTTQVSFFMLKAASEDRYPEPFAALLYSLAEGDVGGLEDAFDRLSPLGATSGHDVLAGLIFYLKVSGMCEKAHEANIH